MEASWFKNLFVNYIDLQRHLAQRDDRGCDVVERNKAAFELLVSHQRDATSKAHAFYFQPVKGSTPSSASAIRVQIFNVDDNLLWATGVGQQAGFFFTAKYDYSTKSTKVFEIAAKSYYSSYGAFASRKSANLTFRR